MKTHEVETMRHEIGRLEHALADSRNHPVAYPILAKHGLMERTENGFRAIDPGSVESRCRQLIASLPAKLPPPFADICTIDDNDGCGPRPLSRSIRCF